MLNPPGCGGQHTLNPGPSQTLALVLTLNKIFYFSIPHFTHLHNTDHKNLLGVHIKICVF